MKVLVVAIACSPYLGSESYVGWTAARVISRDHDVLVITHEREREHLERAMSEGLVPPNLRFHFLGSLKPWAENRLYARLQSWMDYADWTRRAAVEVQRLKKSEKFDVAHHVTYATWRIASPLRHQDLPFVWGPIGGGELFPWRFFSILSSSAKFFEVLRYVSNALSSFSPSVRECAKKAGCIFGSNAITRQRLITLRGDNAGIAKLATSFLDASRLDTLMAETKRDASGVLKLFAGGNLEGRKGVALALQGLAQAKKAGVNFSYRLGGHGPEADYLKRLAAELGIEKEVIFGESLRGAEYIAELQSSHIYLLPSLRDNAPLTLMEAMAAGCVPIVAASGGPGEIVTSECGFPLPVHSPRQITQQIAGVVVMLDRNREKLAALSSAASAQIAKGYSEQHYLDTINQIYSVVLKEANRTPRNLSNSANAIPTT